MLRTKQEFVDGWTPWKPFEPSLLCDSASLDEILGGGQTFRWSRDPGGIWSGSWATYRAHVRSAVNDQLEWRAPRAIADETAIELRRFFACDTDFDALVDRLPWRSDAVLAKAISVFPGLRILRQPPDETLFAFLCSSSKRIAQIQMMVNRVVERHGVDGAAGVKAFPGWAVCAQIGEEGLRACGLGYRARHISAAARFLASDPAWLCNTLAAEPEETRARLISLPGVGEKIADCVRLFAGAQYDAFPIDTWILRVMQELYGLEHWRTVQLQEFARVHFGALAGLAQQFLFAYIRLKSRTR